MSNSEQDVVLALSSSSAGRVSGKHWKTHKSATRRSHLPDGVKTKSWEERMALSKKAAAIKQLESELKEEKRAELEKRREITQERKRALEEKQRIEQEKIKMGAKKSVRLRRKAGRTAKINH